MLRICSVNTSILHIVLFSSACWFVFSGCATLGKDECLNADWRTIGYEDGARGYPASRIGGHRQACAKHGVTADFERYEMGRLEGLNEYCTPRNGYALGAAGKGYTVVCPKHLESAFLGGHRQGMLVYTQQATLQQQESDLKKLYADLDVVERQLGDHEVELIKEGITSRRRKYLLEEIKRLSGQQRDLVAKIAEQETLLEASRLQLKTMRMQMPR